MLDVNKIILVGRLGADPVQRETKNGTAVVHFPLATSRRIRDTGSHSGETESGEGKEQYTEETQWHRVVAWGKQGEICAQYLKKGNPVFVEGAIRSRKYSSKEGLERTAFEVHAENVSFMTSKAPLAVAAEVH